MLKILGGSNAGKCVIRKVRFYWYLKTLKDCLNFNGIQYRACYDSLIQEGRMFLFLIMGHKTVKNHRKSIRNLLTSSEQFCNVFFLLPAFKIFPKYYFFC